MTWSLGALAVLMVVAALASSATGAPKAAEKSKDNAAKEDAAPKGPQAIKMTPGKSASKGPAPTATKGNPKAREAAQKGLNFLAKEAVAWQSQHNCYGCHVQAVTVEALSVGFHNQYEIKQADFDTILDGMLTKNGGSRTAAKLGHSSPSIAEAAKVLGAAAFARYDALVNQNVKDDLLMVAEQILQYQKPDGSVVVGWQRAPVATGTPQSTAQAMIVWKQAYDRTADDQWLTAVQRSEDYLHGVISGWRKSPPGSIQEINYAAMGLLAAGVGNTEKVMTNLTQKLLGMQTKDGSWGSTGAGHGRVSEAFATGQTLYTLRLLGMTDKDNAVDKGTQWLIKHQKGDGGWSHEGFGKAEAMWAVLGLVSTDVLTIAVNNLKSGQHVDGTHRFAVAAKDNKGQGVRQVQVFVDDILVAGDCSGELKHGLDTRVLAEGKHLVRVEATNAAGEVSRRVFEVYSGDVFMTQMGSRYEGGGTAITLRNIAPTKMKNTVEVEIYTLKKDAAAPTADKRIKAFKLNGEQGAMRFFWDGKDDAGQAQGGGKYLARVVLRDGAGEVRQSEDMAFVHDTAEAQRAEWGQVQGQLNFEDGDMAANAEVELLDDEGNVVDKVWTTNQGNYRFRNVDSKRKYRVRVRKKGFKAAESKEFAPAPAAAPVEADMELIAE